MKSSLRPKFQFKQSVIIDASVETVWEFNQDLLKIANYHPRVSKVRLISGKRYREMGVSYECNLNDGNLCIERDIEIIPLQKIVTVFPYDTMGLTKLLPDYIVESALRKIDENKTEITISHFYSSSKPKVWLLNFIVRRKIARETTDMLKAMKKAIESKG